MKTILVLGGTGTTGRRIARRLTSKGLPVRTASRTGGDTHFDLDDPATWAPALDGAAAVYLVEPSLQPGLDQRARIPRLVADAVAAGVRRLVLLSAHGVGRADDSHPLKAAEQAVRDSGADWTILQPDWFAQNFSESFWLPGILTGTLALPTGDGRTPFVDAEDIAEVAAAALTEDRHSGQTYQLTGPQAIGFGEAADLIATATGRTVRHLDILLTPSWTAWPPKACPSASPVCSPACSWTSATAGARASPTEWSGHSADSPGRSRNSSPKPPPQAAGADPATGPRS
ncbi:SDR family oxidoreductase [Streptomyces chiangmaiensis]